MSALSSEAMFHQCIILLDFSCVSFIVYSRTRGQIKRLPSSPRGRLLLREFFTTDD